MRCEICGKEIKESMFIGNNICSTECFTKHFWMKIIKEKDKYIVINGECFYDGGNVNNPSCSRLLDGFGFALKMGLLLLQIIFGTMVRFQMNLESNC